MFYGSPLALPGQSVGLLGGSFDPPHAGHVHITRRALRRFGLDQVWWMVTPGNPLKTEGPASIERRMAACRAIMSHPKVTITDIETQLSTRFTADTLLALQARYPGVRFVWLMGADNLVSFHHWDEWKTIVRSVPIGVLSRPGEQIAAGLSPAARVFASARVSKQAARGLAHMPAPAWCLLPGPMVEMSSTQLRASGAWQR
ncbi:MAG: nicotinate-nucleotide adenylyltransferase [Pseudomonadota bacterium]